MLRSRKEPGNKTRTIWSPFRIALPLLLLAAGTAGAQEVKRLDGGGAWRAYSTKEQGQLLCYMASKPSKDEGNYARRGEIYLMVAHRPAEQSTNVVSVTAGYDYKQDSSVRILIDKEAFELFTHKDTAWAPTEQDDKKLVDAMIKGKTMVVQGTSSRGTKTIDTYSLIGFTKAYRSINKACGR